LYSPALGSVFFVLLAALANGFFLVLVLDLRFGLVLVVPHTLSITSDKAVCPNGTTNAIKKAFGLSVPNRNDTATAGIIQPKALIICTKSHNVVLSCYTENYIAHYLNSLSFTV
jgi:hypothetical protein